MLRKLMQLTLKKSLSATPQCTFLHKISYLLALGGARAANSLFYFARKRAVSQHFLAILKIRQSRILYKINVKTACRAASKAVLPSCTGKKYTEPTARDFFTYNGVCVQCRNCSAKGRLLCALFAPLFHQHVGKISSEHERHRQPRPKRPRLRYIMQGRPWRLRAYAESPWAPPRRRRHVETPGLGKNAHLAPLCLPI